MKNSYYLVMYLILALAMILSCANHNNKIIQNFTINDEERIELARKELPRNIDVIENLHLVDFIYPPFLSASLYNEKIKAYIIIDFEAKNKDEQMYWDIDNPNGYFSQYKNVDEPHLLKDQVKKHLLRRGLKNYTISATVTYEDIVKTVYAENDYEYYPDMNLYQFLFENGEWKFETILSTDEFLK